MLAKLTELRKNWLQKLNQGDGQMAASSFGWMSWYFSAELGNSQRLVAGRAELKSSTLVI